jgi:hypothetical protein
LHERGDIVIMGAVSTMRSSLRRAVLFALLGLCLLVPDIPAVELHFRASGGIVRSRFGDIDQARRDWSASWQAAVAKLPGWGFEQTGRLGQSGCASFGGELSATFGGRWAVGLGLGLWYSDFVDLDGPLYVQKPDAKIEYMSPTKVAAYPVYLFGEYAFPLAKTWEVYLRGGMGFVRAKYVHREKFRDLKDVDPGVSLSELASSGGGVLLAGAGVRYPVGADLGLFVEAGYVMAKVSPFEGDLGAETTGRLYYYQEYDSALDLWQTKLRLQAEEPAGFAYRAVRKANIDLSGLSLRAGLMMRF